MLLVLYKMNTALVKILCTAFELLSSFLQQINNNKNFGDERRKNIDYTRGGGGGDLPHYPPSPERKPWLQGSMHDSS